MKKLILTIATLLAVACSNPIDDPNDPYIKATRNYAVSQVKEHYNTDVKPYDIEITKCDFDFPTPYLVYTYYGELARIKAEYIKGEIATYDEYTRQWEEIHGKIDTLFDIWVTLDEKYAVRGENAKPMYQCVSPIERWDANGKTIDTVTFFLRWCGFDPNDTTQIISDMSARQMIVQAGLENN